MYKSQKELKKDAVRAFLKDCKEGRFDGAYVFSGEEDYLKEHYFGLFKKYFLGPGDDQFALTVFDDMSFVLEDFLDELDNVSFAMSNRILLLKDVDTRKLKGEPRKQLLDALAAVPQGTAVVFYYDSAYLAGDDAARRARQSEITALGKSARLLEFSRQDARELVGWIRRHFEAEGKRIDDQTANYLILVTDADMVALNNEIEKLALYVEGPDVSREDIDEVASRSTGVNIFEITDCILSRNYDRTLRLLTACRLNREEPTVILYHIGVMFSELLYVALAAARGITSVDTVAADFGVKANRKFILRRYFNAVSTLNVDFLKQCIGLISEADRNLKKSRLNKWTELEMLIARMISAQIRK